MNISDAGFRLETQNKLAADEVHLWRVDLAAAAQGEQRWKQILPADERARAARFHFPRDRQYFTAARAVLRMVLGTYADGDPKELVFRYSDKEKPSFGSAKCGRQVEFNVSHSGDICAAGLRTGTGSGRGCGKGWSGFRPRSDRPPIFSRAGAASACGAVAGRKIFGGFSLLDPKGSPNQGARDWPVASS
jgi:hypothetical protein